MTVRTFNINLSKLSKTYSPGEVICGDLIVELSRKKCIQGVKLKFIGECKVHWMDYKNKVKKHYTARETYFEKEVYVYENPNMDTELEPACHVFPFTFPLPMEVPSSFKHEFGKIYYKIEAVLEDPWASNREVSTLFIVDSGHDLNHYPSTPIVRGVENYFYHCLVFCKQVGCLEGRVTIPSNTVAVGEFIKFDINLDQRSGSVQMRKIIVNLKRNITFRSGSSTEVYRTDEAIIGTMKQKGPFPSCSAFQLKLLVPSTPCTGHCRYIEIGYAVQIIFVASGCHSNTVTENEIIIGRRVTSEGRELPTAPESSAPLALPEVTLELPTSMPMPMPMPTGQPQAYGFNIPPYPITPAHPLPTGSSHSSLTAPLLGPFNPTAPVSSDLPTEPPPSYDSVMTQQSKK